ncbi:MAG: type II secretion system protein GspG [Lentisphaerae bacterium]|nr:type II secretion system protein GspG [Lentisphaerota bacterium]
MVPDHLREKRFRDRRRARQRVHHELEQQSGGRKRIPALRFTPIQLIVLLLVMTFLGALLITRARQTPAPAPAITLPQRAQAELNVLRAALEQFQQQCGRYPTEREGLTALISNPDLAGWRGPYVSLVRADPWRSPYRYATASNGASLVSNGPDGQPDTADDLRPSGWERLLQAAP